MRARAVHGSPRAPPRGAADPGSARMPADLPCRDSIQSRRLGFGHRSLRRRPPEAPRRRPSTSCEASRLPAACGPQAPSLPRAGACRPPGCWRRADACLPAGLLPSGHLDATSLRQRTPPGRGRLPAGSPRPPHLQFATLTLPPVIFCPTKLYISMMSCE